MTVLIELFDKDTPILNVLSATVLKPDCIVVLGDKRISRTKYQKPFMNYLNSAGLAARVRIESLNLFDAQSIIARLTSLIHEYGEENCVIDVTGGSETLLLAVGCSCLAQGIRVLLHRPGNNRAIWLSGPDAGSEIAYDIQISARQTIMLAGGELLRSGHIDPREIDEEMEGLIYRVFGVYRKNRARWPQIAQYLQFVNRPEYYKKNALIAPLKVVCAGNILRVDMGIMSELMEAGALDYIRFNARECEFSFATPTVGKYLCDVGAWLELYLFAAMRRSGLFDSLEISAVVSWDDDEDSDDVINEIDIMATAGIGQLFVSCKTGTPDTAALQEIAVLAARFGTQFATPVLATMCDVDKEAPALFRRAAQMGVEIIDKDDLHEDKLQARLTTLKRRWDREQA